MVQFLFDPTGMVGEERRGRLQKKLERVLTRMSAQGKNGGNPFLFMFAATKKHFLRDRQDPENRHHTAMTNGLMFEWDAEYLDECNEDDVHVTMEHEVNHVVSSHCTSGVMEGRLRHLLNMVLDFYADGMIEEYHKQTGRDAKWKLYGSKMLGQPIRIQEYKDWLDGQMEFREDQKFAGDPAALEVGIMELYRDILPHYENSPRRCPSCTSFTWDPKTGQSKIEKPWEEPCCATCGQKVKFDANGEPAGFDIQGLGPGSLDGHTMSEIDPQRLREDVMSAADKVRQMYGRGHLPGTIETMLDELENPRVSSATLIGNAFMSRRVSKGDLKDWSRFRRRPEYIYEKNEAGEWKPGLQIYRPTKRGFAPKYLVMCDTSGSMGDDDCARGVKEIKTVASMYKSEGYIVPNDVRPIWSGMVRIERVEDLKKFKPSGRGGTDFNLFFDEYKERLGVDHDLLFIITDGDVDHIPMEKCPYQTDVVWLVTSAGREFKPNFGRVIYLNGDNRAYNQ